MNQYKRKIAFVLVLVCIFSSVNSKNNYLKKQKPSNKFTSHQKQDKEGLEDQTQLSQLEENSTLQKDLNQNSSTDEIYDEKQTDQKNYHNQQFYLWEEGVTNLAYDDFLETKFITNIEYLGAGYNIAYANPLTTLTIDPGYTTFHAFDFHYPDNKLDALSADADYFIPEGVVLNSQSSCETSFKSQQISSMKEYQKSLQLGANMSYKGWGFAFKASFDYKKAQEQMGKSDTLMITSQADCEVFDLQVSPYIQPKWSKVLNAAFRQFLKEENDQELYYKFFDKFGTHVTQGVKLGAKFGFNYQMRKSQVKQMKEMGLSVEVGGGGYGFSGNLETEYQKNSKQAFKSATKSWTTFSIGAPPDPDNDSLKWASQAKSSPMPIQADLISWRDFLLKYRNGNTIFTDGELKKIESNLLQHQQTYCQNFLLPQNLVDFCYDIQASKNYNQVGLPNVIPRQREPKQEFKLLTGQEGYYWAKWSDIPYVQQLRVDYDGNLYVIVEGQKGIQQLDSTTDSWETIKNTDNIIEFDVLEKKIIGITQNKDQEQNGLVFIDLNKKKDQLNILDIGFLEKDEQCLYVAISNKGEVVLQTNSKKYQYHIIKNPAKKRFITTKERKRNNMKLISFDNDFITQLYQDTNFVGLYFTQNLYTKQMSFRYMNELLPKAEDICITDQGWGYIIDYQNIIHFNNELLVAQSTNLYFTPDYTLKAKNIVCKSTENGPFIYAIGLDGYIYKKVI